MKPLLILALLAVTGCTSTESVLSGVSYGCLNIEIDGYFTDSGAAGRAVKLPEGESITPDNLALLEALCDT